MAPGRPRPITETTTSTWNQTQLRSFKATDDLHISPFREHGVTYGTPTRNWSIVAGDDHYVRPCNGPDSRWHRAAMTQQRGRIRIRIRHRERGALRTRRRLRSATARRAPRLPPWCSRYPARYPAVRAAAPAWSHRHLPGVRDRDGPWGTARHFNGLSVQAPGRYCSTIRH
ncbi:DUF2255 family protein [Streptomyces sp. NPDC055189]